MYINSTREKGKVDEKQLLETDKYHVKIVIIVIFISLSKVTEKVFPVQIMVNSGHGLYNFFQNILTKYK